MCHPGHPLVFSALLANVHCAAALAPKCWSFMGLWSATWKYSSFQLQYYLGFAATVNIMKSHAESTALKHFFFSEMATELTKMQFS